MRSPHPATREQPLLATARESAATKIQHSHTERNIKKKKKKPTDFLSHTNVISSAQKPPILWVPDWNTET